VAVGASLGRIIGFQHHICIVVHNVRTNYLWNYWSTWFQVCQLFTPRVLMWH